MDRKEIVRRFFEAGVLLTPEILAKIDETNIDFFLKKAQEASTTVFSNITTEEKVKIDVKRVVGKEKITPKDIAAYYANKYNGIKALLLEKTRPISIKNTMQVSSTVNLIGMVREITATGFTLEDNTGKIEVMSKKHAVSEDDVVGVIGEVRENVLFENGIVFPDVPADNRIKKISGIKIMLAKEFNCKEGDKGINHVFAEKANASEDVTTGFTNPTWISISKGNNEMKMVIFDPQKDITLQDTIQYLVKRHLSPTMEMITSEEDNFLLNPLPDIVWILNENKWAKTHSGVTLVSCGSGKAVIDLGTREIEFVE